MVYEKTFARIYDSDPFSLAKLRKVRKKANMDTVFILFIEIGVTFSISRYYIVNTKVVNIQSFVRTIDLFSDIGSSSLNLYAMLVFNYKSIVCLEHLTSFDLCLRAQQDFICILPFLQLFSIAWFIPQYFYFYSVNVAINVITVYQLSGIRYLISKRDQLVAERVAESENTLKVIGPLRRILQYNKQVDEAYSLRTVNVLCNSVIVLLHSMNTCWRVYRLQEVYDCFEYLELFFTLFIHGRFSWI